MKRRNFLKAMAGLFCLPLANVVAGENETAGLSKAELSPKIKTRFMEMNTTFFGKHRVQVDGVNDDVVIDIFVDVEDDYIWINSAYHDAIDMNGSPLVTKLHVIPENSVVTVVTEGGMIVSFTPILNKETGDWYPVTIGNKRYETSENMGIKAITATRGGQTHVGTYKEFDLLK